MLVQPHRFEPTTSRTGVRYPTNWVNRRSPSAIFVQEVDPIFVQEHGVYCRSWLVSLQAGLKALTNRPIVTCNLQPVIFGQLIFFSLSKLSKYRKFALFKTLQSNAHFTLKGVTRSVILRIHPDQGAYGGSTKMLAFIHREYVRLTNRCWRRAEIQWVLEGIVEAFALLWADASFRSRLTFFLCAEEYNFPPV